MTANNISLVKCSDIEKYTAECQRRTADNPEYKYLWLGTYGELPADTKAAAYDALKIRYKMADAGNVFGAGK